LIDFGSTIKLDSYPDKFCGTLKYGSPEVQLRYLEKENEDFKSKYEKSEYCLETQEVWCLGYILYGMVFGFDPFRNQRQILEMELLEKMKRYQASKNPRYRMISTETINLIDKLMAKKTAERPKLKDITAAPFFTLEFVSIDDWIKDSIGQNAEAKVITEKTIRMRIKKLLRFRSNWRQKHDSAATILVE
jgi:serine/threonine protein kinase